MAQLIKKKASYTNETPGGCVDLWMYLFKSREKNCSVRLQLIIF